MMPADPLAGTETAHADQFVRGVSAGKDGRRPAGWLPGIIQQVRGRLSLSRKFRRELGQGLDLMQRLTRETEGDILRLGEQLQEFFLAAQDMTDQGSNLVELVSGQAVTDTTRRLEHLVEEIRARFGKTQAGFAENLKILAKVRKELAAASHPLDGFNQMVRGLRMLGVSTRIESARMQGADEGFQFLAEEVSRLADTIKKQTESMGSLLSGLSNRLDETLGSMRGLGDGLSGGMDKLAAVVGQSLEELRQWRDQSELAAARVAANTRQVHADMAEVISSMQFHDITRQRLEHVQEPLSGLIEGSAKAPLADVCGLQARLLEHAEEELNQAVDSMQNSLRGIAGSLRQVARDAQLMTRGEDGQEVSHLERLEADLSDIMAIAGQTEKALARLRDLVESVVETLEQVHSSLGAIDSISYAIKFVALNAAIKSARLGGEGAALESIAQAIQHLSAEARNAAKDLTTVLGSLGESAEPMRRTMVGDSGSGDQTVGELESLLESIRQDNQACNGLLRTLEQNGHDLAARLEQGAGGIRFHQSISRGVTEVTGCLNRLLDRDGPKDAKLAIQGRSAQIDKHYTMASERQIHQAWVQDSESRPPRPETPPAAAPADQGEQELGDNVELF